MFHVIGVRRADEHRIHVGGGAGFLVAAVRGHPLELPPVLLRAFAVSRGEAQGDAAQGAGDASVSSRDRAAADDTQVQGTHGVIWLQWSLTYCPTRSAFAAMVRLGFTPPAVGMKLPSTTKRLSTPCRRQYGSRGA